MPSGRFRMLRCPVAGVEAVEADTRHAFARHTHDQYGIGVIHRGAQRSRSGRGLVEAEAGDAITVNPGEVHDGVPIGDSGRSWRMLYFDPALIAEAARDLGDGRPAPGEFRHPVIHDPATAARIQALFALLTAERPADATLRREELLLRLLAGLMHERREAGTAGSASAAIQVARSLIDDDPAAPVTLADLSRACGLSRFQVLRGFAKATGLTPHAYLIQRRVDTARRLIARGAALADAAAASGFADQSHMTRIFAAKYGLSPGAYARAVA